MCLHSFVFCFSPGVCIQRSSKIHAKFCHGSVLFYPIIRQLAWWSFVWALFFGKTWMDSKFEWHIPSATPQKQFGLLFLPSCWTAAHHFNHLPCCNSQIQNHSIQPEEDYACHTKIAVQQSTNLTWSGPLFM